MTSCASYWLQKRVLLWVHKFYFCSGNTTSRPSLVNCSLCLMSMTKSPVRSHLYRGMAVATKLSCKTSHCAPFERGETNIREENRICKKGNRHLMVLALRKDTQGSFHTILHLKTHCNASKMHVWFCAFKMHFLCALRCVYMCVGMHFHFICCKATDPWKGINTSNNWFLYLSF